MIPREIGAEYKVDPAAADAKYTGKVVEIDGAVLQCLDTVKDGKVSGEYLTVATFEDLSSIVKCEFAENGLWKKVARGSKVKIKGLWKANYKETFDRYILENSVFTEIGPNPRIILTAAELSAEARADRELFRSRFFGPDLQISGEVAGVEHMRGDSVRLVLKTSEAPRILLDTQSANVEEELKRRFPAGTKVTIVGQYLDRGAAAKATDVFLTGRILKDE